MIYLIDDNQNNLRYNNYGITFTDDDTFDNLLITWDKIEKRDDLNDISHLIELECADCILIHSSTEDYSTDKGFLPGSRSNVIKIIEQISVEGSRIPLVIFSNRDGDALFNFDNNPNFIRGMKKNIFYERLYAFLENYRQTNKIDLRLLAFGENYSTKEIIKFSNNILNVLSNVDLNNQLTLSILSTIISDFKIFISKAYPDINFNELLIDLEDNPIIIKDFKEKITKITDSYAKYGENIHSWK